MAGNHDQATPLFNPPKMGNSETSGNTPPFDDDHAIYTSNIKKSPSKYQLHLPALYNRRDADGKLTDLTAINIDDRSSLHTYFSQHLSVTRLNTIHKHLWLAGLPRRAQPLHYHLLHNRKFVITERADHHLLWQNEILLLMPLPPFLLDHDIWRQHLCADQALFELANGMLLSYIWLICSESDLRVAHDAGLMPKAVDWPKWTVFVRSISDKLYNASEDLNPRYIYGELRLRRINWIYRCCRCTTNFTTFLRGYSYGYTSYGSFFERNTAWIAVATVYIAVVLTAMQVGLATKELQDNLAFSRASYGFTVFAILAPLGGLSLVVFLLLVLVPFNLSYALGQRKKAYPAKLLTDGTYKH